MLRRNRNLNRNTRPIKASGLALLAVGLLLLGGLACGAGASPAPDAAAAVAPTEQTPRAWPPADIASLERVTQELVAPPFLPQHAQVNAGPPRVVAVRMEIAEKEVEIEPGVFFWSLSFNGSVPGPIIVVHEGDYVELTLVNPADNLMFHNIDFHASMGALGGGDLTKIRPGEEVVLRFRALKPGVFIYHCAPGGDSIPRHVTHGMNGAIMVLPRDGLKDPAGNPLRYDRAYYIGEQDYYLPRDDHGAFIRYEDAAASAVDDIAAMKTLTPTHIVFNGIVGALQGEGQLTAQVGENVLLVHSQANRPSYPHLIGGHGDYVWERGSFNNPPALDLESWVIAAGSAGASLHTIRQPGTYIYLSHNLIEALLFDAKAILVAKGEWNNDLMEQVKPPGPP